MKKAFLIWTAVLLLMVPIQGAMAADISSDTDTNTTVRVIVNSGIPYFNQVKFMDSSWNLVSNTQIDVGQTYYFEINASQPGGWADLQYMNITMWYDNSDDTSFPSEPVNMDNTHVRFVYQNTTGTGTFGIAGTGNGEFTLGTCTDTIYNTTTHILNISFTMNDQVRHASGDGAWNTERGFNDEGSWNYRINGTNINGEKSTNWDDEFGIYKYVAVTAMNDPQGSGVPNEHITLGDNGPTEVTFKTNDKYRLSVSIQDLSGSTGDTITADNVGMYGGNIATLTYFAGSGDNLWIYGSSTTYEDAPASGTVQTVQTHWEMNIPNVLSGTYTSPVTYTISQP